MDKSWKNQAEFNKAQEEFEANIRQIAVDSSSSSGSSSSSNDALDNYLDQAERRYKIHQDEGKYVEELTYAYNNLAKTDEERLDIADKIEQAWKDYAKNRIKDTEHIIALEEKLFGEGGRTIKDKLDELSSGGTVNLALRPQIDTSELNAKGWDAGTGIATVFSSTISNTDFDDLMPASEDETIAINFTPIIVDPVTGEYKGVLSEDALYTYAHDVMKGIRRDDLNLQIGAAFTGDGAIDKAVQAANEVHTLHERLMNGMTADTPLLISLYDDIQDIAHDEAERLRGLGFDNNSDEIQELQNNWWDAEDKKQDIYSKLHEDVVSGIERERDAALEINPYIDTSDYYNRIIVEEKGKVIGNNKCGLL